MIRPDSCEKEFRPPSDTRTGDGTGLFSHGQGKLNLEPVLSDSNENSAFTPLNDQESLIKPEDQANGSPAAPTADQEKKGEQEPKLFVDVNVANFGLQRIVVFDGDTVDSLVSDFVKRCPIDEFMVEKLKLLLQ